MPRYFRAKVEGGFFFFTVALANRSSDLLVRHVDHLRQVYRVVEKRYPFETIAICILPDHLHAVWSLPPNDADFSTRWSQIKSAFSRPLASDARRTSSKVAKREKGIWQRRYWEHAIRDEADLERLSITFTSTQSSMGTCRACATGRTAVSIVTSRAACCHWTGEATRAAARANSVSD
jgi:putative transposase